MPFIGWPRSTVGVAYGCPRDRLGWPLEREWRARGCSWEWCRVPGRERRSGASCTRATGVARALAERGGALARAAGERGGRGSKWAACWRGADVEGHRLARGGGSRWSGDAASTVGCPARRSRARLWPASAAFPRPRVATCVWRLQEVWAKVLGSLGCSGKLRGEKEAEREGGIHCPEKKNGVLPPSSLLPRAASTQVLEGD